VQAGVKIDADQPVSEQLGTIETALSELQKQAHWAGGKVQPDATFFIALVHILKQLAEQVEDLADAVATHEHELKRRAELSDQEIKAAQQIAQQEAVCA
jgi:hypothetical protein